MPETLKGHSTKICEKLAEKYCAKCAAIGSTDCLDHGGLEEFSGLGKRRLDDIGNCFSSKSKTWIKQQQEPPRGVVKPVAVRTNASGSGVPGLATPRNHDDKSDEQPSVENSKIAESPKEETGLKEGGVRFRTKLGKWVVEYRPSRFKWKLWMGTYTTVEEGRRACDCARFYAGQEKGGFYFKDSPSLFEQQGQLSRPFSRVSKDVRDKLFNQELKRRAKQIIKRDNEAKASLGGGGKGGSNTNESRRRMKPGVKRADNININVQKALNPMGPATTTMAILAKEIINMDTTSVNPRRVDRPSPNLGFDSPSTPRPADAPFPNLGFDSPSTSSQGSGLSNGRLHEEGDSEPLGGGPPHSSVVNGVPESDVFQDLPPLSEPHSNLIQDDWGSIFVLGITTDYNANNYLTGSMSIRSTLDAFDDDVQCDDDLQLWVHDQ